MQEFEYKVIRPLDADLYRYSSSETKFLNKHGKDGWELVSVVDDDDNDSNTIYYFKRKIE